MCPEELTRLPAVHGSRLVPLEGPDPWGHNAAIIAEELARRQEMLQACEDHPDMKFRLRTKINERGG